MEQGMQPMCVSLRLFEGGGTQQDGFNWLICILLDKLEVCYLAGM